MDEYDYNQLVKQYLETSEGKESLKENKISQYGFNKAEVSQICRDLRLAILDAYYAQLSPAAANEMMKEYDMEIFLSPEGGFYEVGNRKSKKRLAKVVFSDRALRRKSLYVTKSHDQTIYTKHHGVMYRGTSEHYWTGEHYRASHIDKYAGMDKSFGVYDIFGLLINGYGISGRRPWGEWMSENAGGAVFYQKSDSLDTGALRSRAGNNFIAKVARDFESKYPGLHIELPENWGGAIADGDNLTVPQDVI